MLALTVICAFGAHRQFRKQAKSQFAQHADIAHQFTALTLRQEVDKQPRDLLRAYFRLETRRGHFDHMALIVGSRIAIAHSLDWEGVDASYAVGRPDRLVDLIAAHSPGTVEVRTNRDLDRLEGIAVMPYGDEHTSVLLYMSGDAGKISQQAWARFWSIMGIGTLLAVAAGVATYLCFRANMVIPLAKLQRRIDQRGLCEDLSLDGLGELVGLMHVLESATTRLLKHKDDKITALQSALNKSEEESALETQLLQHLVQDLRCSMSAIMGYSELLVTSDSNPSDRINYIRAIQQEARRIARVARQIHQLLTEWSTGQESQDSDAPIAPLRALVEKLVQSQAAVLQIAPPEHGRSRLDAKTEEPGVERDVLECVPDTRPIKTRLTGSILIYGRKDDATDALLTELHDVGLGAVLVPDKSGLENELSRGGHALVLVNLSRGDRVAKEMSEMVRRSFPDGPIVAVLPGSTRGDGNKYVSLGFDDFFYTPITRQNILATIVQFR